MVVKVVDIVEFARRVERLCEFLLDGLEEKDGSDDIVAIQKLKEDAADLQVSRDPLSINRLSITGLHDHMKKI